MNRLSRRGFIQAGLAVGGGLLLEIVPGVAGAAGSKASFTPGAYLRITADDVITLILARVEMGQGTSTMHAQLLAEELEVSPSKLTLEFAGNDRRFDNPTLGFQITGGSTSTTISWGPYRQAGATAREMLIGAAAKTWGVPRGECVAKDGAVVLTATGQRLSYGALAETAASMPAPPVKPREKDFTVIGKPTPRVDSMLKVTGKAQFGLDVQVPGAKVAVLIRSPVPGGTLRSFDDTEAKKLSGVSQVVAVPRGVAVVGDTYFHARRAAQVVKVEWDDGALAKFDSKVLHDQHLEALRGTGGRRVKNAGDALDALSRAVTVLEAEYSCPYLAHATMEPQNATAWVRDGKCEIWAPTQGPMLAAEQVARALDIPQSDVTVHQTWLGGGFGRRIAQDYVIEAAQVSKAISGPVKVVWSREDDLKHSPYRPAATHRVRGTLDTSGKPLAWHHRVATQSIVSQVLSDFAGAVLPAGLHFMRRAVASMGQGALAERDDSSFEGVDSLPYELPHLAVDFVPVEPGVPVMFWRSVGHSHTAFATESFIDELAHAAKVDPVEYRRSLLMRQHRHRWVLELVAEKIGWTTPAPEGVGRGVAVHKSFESYAAAAVEVRIEDGAIAVKRVVMAIDCGRVVNPDIVKQQLESAAIFGLSAALKQRITFENGRVQQSNFHDFAPLRLNEVPRIETYLRENEAAPTGVGEPGLPVIAPAVANAVFALTGKRLRTLPLSLE
ncbi:MAG: xanthine dehydrogenase family protein molybdopterin-binding subunit [Archangium sp.]|nr:xanthine dehydrogenase family protein molybdopterin-binding subunit [Archangium sp.]